MTIVEIHKVVSAVKPVSRRQIRRYLKRFKIAPVGIRQNPQRFPEDAAVIITSGLGAAPTLSMPQLRDLRRRSEKARTRNNGKPTPRIGNGRVK